MNDTETISIDGSMGEGGGQILRTSMALSCITGKRLHIENIRSARRNPGLAKQHVCCVQAACEICNGKSNGAGQGSKVLDFQPGAVRGGKYYFDVGSAGSISLVMQTILPALFLADKSSIVSATGGTHNPLAPPYDFLSEAFLPAIGSAGFRCDCRLLKYGFFPAGGGKMTFNVQPRQQSTSNGYQIINLCQTTREFHINALIYTAKLPIHIAQRQEKLLLQSGLDLKSIKHIEVTDSDGPGNAVCIRHCYYTRTTIFTEFGMRGKPSEEVIDKVVSLVKNFISSGAAVDCFLADQLLIYMAIANGGCYTTDKISNHTETNIEVIKKFLPVDFVKEQQGNYIRVTCQPAQ
jgi:RNA 3'-terminal phosphate cyclase (ATP)